MKIAFCDDNISFISFYDDYILKVKSLLGKIDYEEYSSGEKLLKKYAKEKTPFDIVFLDIEMKEMNGIDTARQIRKYDANVIIIFITSHSEFVFESFEVTPFRFLVKPLDFERFKEVLILSYDKIKTSNRAIYITTGKSTIRIPCNGIYYIESQMRKLIFHTINGNYRTYGKITDYANKFYINDFFSVHKSYLINYNHVIEFNNDSLKLVNNTTIPISENKRKYAKEEYMKFILRNYKR